jgi:hypothetical protein
MCSMVGSDPSGEWPRKGIWVDDRGKLVSDNSDNDYSDVNSTEGEQLDPYHYVQEQMFDAFDTGNKLHKECGKIADRAAVEDALEESMEKLDELYRHASQPVYSGNSVSIVSTVIVIINMAVIHGVGNTYVDELLTYLSTLLLSNGNQLPSTYYEAKKLIRKLGMNYDIIHACSGGCVFFRNQYKDLRQCPVRTCNKSRYIEGSEVIPAKVIRHFPLIPRLLCMYHFSTIVELLKSHPHHASPEEGVMRSTVDSPAWKHVDQVVDSSFTADARNLRFGLSLDGINPFL